MINVIGVLIFLPFINQFAELVSRTSPDLPRQIANAHTIFNVAVSAICFPFVRQLTLLSARLTPASRCPEKTRVTAFIDEAQIGVPTVALNDAARELTRLGEITAQMVQESCEALAYQTTRGIKNVLDLEKGLVDPVTRELSTFINTLMREDLSLAQQKRCFQLQSLLIDVERVGDIAEDIAEYALERFENQVVFSTPAVEEFQNLWKHAHRTYALSVQAFSEGDAEKARLVCRLESDFDRMYWQSRQAHIHRIEEGICQPEAEVIFTDTLRDLERISDHADNLGISVVRNCT